MPSVPKSTLLGKEAGAGRAILEDTTEEENIDLTHTTTVRG
jgi:hypothetical protein